MKQINEENLTSLRRLIRLLILCICIIFGEIGNIDYHSSFNDMPNDDGGSEAIMEEVAIKKKRKRLI